MPYGFETPLTLFIALIGFLIVLFAQMKINRTYQKYRSIKTKQSLSGCEVARQILDAHGLTDIHVIETNGELTDHYDPSRKVVRLSRNIFHGETVAAAAIAAHECGHAIQDKENYFFMKVRGFLVPVVNFVTYIGYFVAIISLFFGAMGYLKVGIWIILAAIVFQLITLPVEFDASKRGLACLQNQALIEETEYEGAKAMLSSAAFTYVASFISSILNLLRLIIMTQDRDR